MMNLRLLRLLPALLLLLLPSFEAAAQSQNPSGLPLPRFVTTRSGTINVRVGPGTKYDIAWTYKISGVPVEIVQEFDIWRKIRDVDGSEGWVQQNMLSGSRAGFIAPEENVDRVAMRSAASPDGGIIAWLPLGFRITLQSCEANWCRATAVNHPVGQPTVNFSGYVAQGDIWGVYRSESFD